MLFVVAKNVLQTMRGCPVNLLKILTCSFSETIMKTITLHKAQSPIIEHLFKPLDPNNPEEWKLRFATLVGSRGLGKTFVASTAVALALGELESLDESVPNKNIALLCGSHTQVRDVYWPVLAYQLGLESLAISSSRENGRFVFPNRTEIKCWSADAYERLRGTGQYMIVGDEMPTWKVPGGSIKDAWESVLEPCIITRWSAKQAKAIGAPSPGRALFPSTPLGKDYFYDLSQRDGRDSRWKNFHYTYRDAPHLSVQDIEDAKKNADPIKFAREYEASFEDSGLNVFYTFNQRLHVKNLEPFEEDEVVHAAIDFNIMLNCTSFHAIRGGQIHCLGEHRGSANTEELATYIKRRFPKNKVVCYPDPTGKRRVTSATIGATDFAMLREAGFTVLAKKASPPIVDSVAAVNRKLLNAAGDIDFYVDASCKGVIDSFERTRWLEDRAETATIDKSDNVEHYSDGIRYMVDYLFPVARSRASVVVGSSF